MILCTFECTLRMSDHKFAKRLERYENYDWSSLDLMLVLLYCFSQVMTE